MDANHDGRPERYGIFIPAHFIEALEQMNHAPVEPGALFLSIPPEAREVYAEYLGLIRAGWKGLIVAGVCFITPAMLIVLALAWCYVTYGEMPGVGQALVGIKACMVAIVASAMWRFAHTGVKDRFTAAVALLTVGGSLLLRYFDVPH